MIVKVGRTVARASGVDVGISGVKVAKGVDGIGVGIATGLIVLLSRVIQTSKRHSNRDFTNGI